MNHGSSSLSRRRLMQAAIAAGAAASTVTSGSTSSPREGLSFSSDGTYEVQPLSHQNLMLGVVQSRVRAVDGANPAPGIKANLKHMLELIDNAFHYGGGPDLLQFHEFPITGWNKWSRKEILRFAIDIPGPETEAISAKAKEYGCYIVFGSYARDPAWPGHVLSVTTIIGPQGEIVDKHWKARNIKGVFPGFELFTTTVYDVLERYVEMYGLDAVIPVTRTPIGNLATSSIQREPELFRALAMKGAEIILRTATGGFTPLDMQATSLYNGVYTAICNNAVSPDNPGFYDDAGAGGSAVYGPRGEVVADTDSPFETLVRARIPIGAFRARHRQPFVHMDLYRPVFEAYQNAYPPDLFSQYLPDDLDDAARFLRDKSVWR